MDNQLSEKGKENEKLSKAGNKDLLVQHFKLQNKYTKLLREHEQFKMMHTDKCIELLERCNRLMIARNDSQTELNRLLKSNNAVQRALKQSAIADITAN